MKAIFLASGRSSRMSPVTDKNLLSFYGHPLCIHLLHRAQQGGVTSFVVVTNEDNNAAITELLTQYNIPAEVTIQQDLREGMAGGVRDGLAMVADYEGVMVLGGNDAIHPSAYTSVIEQLKTSDVGILGIRVEEYFPGGYMETDEEGRILSIIEKPEPGTEPSNLVNIVCHGFREASLLKNALEKADSKKDDVYEVALDSLFQSQKCHAVAYEGAWQAVKYPWHVLDMKEVLFPEVIEDRIHHTAQVHPSAEVGPEVILSEGVVIRKGACVTGKTFLGKGVHIGNNALVRDSYISHECDIGFSTEIARSYLSRGVSAHLAYVGDSVVMPGVNFGAYSATANLRFDGREVKTTIKGKRISSGRTKYGVIVGSGAQIGIHASLMPGVHIPPGSHVDPGEVFRGKMETGVENIVFS